MSRLAQPKNKDKRKSTGKALTKQKLLHCKPLESSIFPTEWAQTSKNEPPSDVLSMSEQYSQKLPRVSVTLISARNLLKTHTFVKLSFGYPRFTSSWRSSTSKKSAKDPEWNEQVEFVIEDQRESELEQVSYSPFLFICRVFQAKSVGKDVLIGTFAVDIKAALGMRLKRDIRKFQFPLDTQGFVQLSFTALTDLVFPTMNMDNVDGEPNTSTLAKKTFPVVEISVCQALYLKTEYPDISSSITVSLQSPNVGGDSMLSPRSLVLESTKAPKTNCLVTTYQPGSCPYWGETCEVTLMSKQDVLRFAITCIISPDKKKAKKKYQSQLPKDEIVCSIGVNHLRKLATALPSRRWYAFPGPLKGAALGIQFRAITDFEAVEKLPSFRMIDNAGDDKQFSLVQSKHSEQEKLVIISPNIHDVLAEIANLDFVKEDPTLYEDQLFAQHPKPQASPESILHEMDQTDERLADSLSRLELEASKAALVAEKEAQSQKESDIKKQMVQLQEEKVKLLEGGIASVGGKKQFQDQISNLLDEVTQDTIASMPQITRLSLPELDGIPKPSTTTTVTTTTTTSTTTTTTTTTIPTTPTIAQSPSTTLSGTSCNLCKNWFPSNELQLMRGKKFCSGCKKNLIAEAQKRGLKL